MVGSFFSACTKVKREANFTLAQCKSKMSEAFQLKSMFPQVDIKKINELLELYNDDLEFCTDAVCAYFFIYFLIVNSLT
jgi:hypothetical protein